MREEKIKRSKKPEKKKSGWKLATVVVVAVILLVSIYVVLTQTNNSSPPQGPEKAIGDFNLVSTVPSMQNGKIVVLFIGAEACPFCAAESWSIVNTLSQYGMWSGLSRVVSNATDSIPSVPGWAFANASLSSNQLVFEEVETTTTSWDQKLQSLNSTDSQLFQKYDPNGAIPFLLIGEMYLHMGSAVAPNQLSGMNWYKCYNLSKVNGTFHDQIVGEVSNISKVINYVKGKGSLDAVIMHYSSVISIICFTSTYSFIIQDITRAKVSL